MSRFKFTLFLLSHIFVTQAHVQEVVKVKTGFATAIVCPVPPELVTIDNAKHFSIQNFGRYLLVKPLIKTVSSNMFIKSGPYSFQLVLVASNVADIEKKLVPSPSVASKEVLPLPTIESPSAGIELDKPKVVVSLAARKDLALALNEARSILPTFIKTPRRYAYSIQMSNIILGLDYIMQIKNKMFVICTLINNSRTPYEVDLIQFRLIEQQRNLIFFKKTTEESELAPVREFYARHVGSSKVSRMLFIFDTQAFADTTLLEIKCTEKDGEREVFLRVPGSYIEK